MALLPEGSPGFIIKRFYFIWGFLMRLTSILALREVSAGVAVDKIIRKISLRLARNKEFLPVRLNKKKSVLKVRPYTTDAEVAFQCFNTRQYEIPVVVGAPPLHRDAVQAAYQKIISSGDTPLILDCGANIGASSIWLKMKYPEANILAVEPAPDNYRALKINATAFGGIETLEAGIGPADGIAYLQDDGGGAWGYKTGHTKTDQEIKITSLNSLMSKRSGRKEIPFIIKLDIEGAEKNIFDESAYADFDAFPIIIIESHDFYMPTSRTSSPFFRYHAASGRDFMFGAENIFSIDMTALIFG